MANEFEMPVNYAAEEFVIGTILMNSMAYGHRTIDYAITYIDENWFFGSFYQNVFTVVKNFRKDHKDINKMDVGQYMVENEMGDASDIYRSINQITKFCSEDAMFWRFVKLIERLHWQREQYKLVEYLVRNIGGGANG